MVAAKRVRAAGGLSPMPVFIAPQLPTLVPAPPQGDAWVHEIKHDGYRKHARLDGGAVKLITRRDHDLDGALWRSPGRFREAESQAGADRRRGGVAADALEQAAAAGFTGPDVLEPPEKTAKRVRLVVDNAECGDPGGYGAGSPGQRIVAWHSRPWQAVQRSLRSRSFRCVAAGSRALSAVMSSSVRGPQRRHYAMSWPFDVLIQIADGGWRMKASLLRPETHPGPPSVATVSPVSLLARSRCLVQLSPRPQR